MSAKTRLAAKIGAGAAALAIPLVVHFEGTVYRTYVDPVGIVTSCTGHTGPELELGQRFTKEQCDEQLASDLFKHSSDLDCITAPLTDYQRAAYLSFTFNVGKKAFCGSTLVRRANAGDTRGACAELSRWTMAGGRELPGLVRRRAAERAMCEGRISATRSGP